MVARARCQVKASSFMACCARCLCGWRRWACRPSCCANSTGTQQCGQLLGLGLTIRQATTIMAQSTAIVEPLWRIPSDSNPTLLPPTPLLRCHPDIAAVPNAQFYGGRLIDGCSSEQRASLLPGLPSLVFLDVRGQEQYGAGACVFASQ